MSLTSGWYVVSQMGHKTLYGHVQEVEVAGSTMLLVTQPAAEGRAPTEEAAGWEPLAEEVEYVSGASLYGITPSTEEEVREARTILAARHGYLGRTRKVLPAPQEWEEADVVDDDAPFDRSREE